VQAVTKILLESPNLDVAHLNAAWVRRTAHKPEDFTDEECQTVVKLVKALDPYTPKRVSSPSGKTSPPTANAASMIRIVLLSNHLLQYTGYSQYTRRFAPAPSVASLHPIPLGAASIYDTLCWKAPNNFDIYDSNHKPITSVKTATKNRNDTFTNFFDLDAIYWICRKYKLRFAFRYVFLLQSLTGHAQIIICTFREKKSSKVAFSFYSIRLTFVNRYTVRLLGEVIPEGADRGEGAPIISMLDESKKDKSKRRAGTDWSREGQRTGITQTMALQRLTDINNQIKDVEAVQKQKRDLWLEADRIRHDAAVHQRKVAKSGSRQQTQTTINNQPKPAKSDQERQAEAELRSARKTADTAFLSWLQKDEEHRTAKATRYALQRLSKTKPNYDPPSQQRSYEARPTWTNPTAEAKTENLFIDCLLDAVLADPTRAIGFDADDPGLCKLDTSVTTTLKDVTQSIRQ